MSKYSFLASICAISLFAQLTHAQLRPHVRRLYQKKLTKLEQKKKRGKLTRSEEQRLKDLKSILAPQAKTAQKSHPLDAAPVYVPINSQ